MFLKEPPRSEAQADLYSRDAADDGQDAGQLTPREKALAAWARQVARAPNATPAQPDRQLADSVPAEIREAVNYGRPVSERTPP
jgi:hypothetical protein